MSELFHYHDYDYHPDFLERAKYFAVQHNCLQYCLNIIEPRVHSSVKEIDIPPHPQCFL